MIKLFKYLYLMPCIFLWIYILAYPLIKKIFKLNLKSEYARKEYFKMLITSITPFINILALYLAIEENIEAFKERSKK